MGLLRNFWKHCKNEQFGIVIVFAIYVGIRDSCEVVCLSILAGGRQALWQNSARRCSVSVRKFFGRAWVPYPCTCFPKTQYFIENLGGNRLGNKLGNIAGNKASTGNYGGLGNYV